MTKLQLKKQILNLNQINHWKLNIFVNVIYAQMFISSNFQIKNFSKYDKEVV